jgi:multiple sugar transport system permease protein
MASTSTVTQPTTPAAPPRVRRRISGTRLGYGLVSPVVLVLLAITGFPLVYNIWNSFHYFNLLNPTDHRFVGLSNYRQVFSTQTGLGPAIEHTILYAVISVLIEVAIGLGIALLLNRPIRGRGIARSLLLLPWAVPTVIAATVWKTMLDPQSGGVDYVLSLLHLPGGHTTWLNTSSLLSWLAILFADTWQVVPFVAIVLLAGLQGIPRDLYEAAEVDGASGWRAFWHITLPLLRPALLVVLVFRTLSALMIFDIIYALTAGGPGTSTSTLAYVDWKAFLVNGDFGLGGAISVVMVIIALIIAAVYRFVLRPKT